MQAIKISIKTPLCEVNCTSTLTEDGLRRIKISDDEAVLFVIRDLLSSIKYSTVVIKQQEE
jgi:hypothetical protein